MYLQAVRGKSLLRLIMLLTALAFGVSGCERQAEAPVAGHELQPIAAGDECHVCGMEIAGFPGPKGQAFIRNRAAPLKFCSTVDLFSWLLQPETAAVLEAAYVHDMDGNDWERPDDNRYVDARDAWYVVSHEQRGAMGPTLMSFADKAAADRYAVQHGGQTMAYADVTLETLAALSGVGAPHDDHGGHHH